MPKLPSFKVTVMPRWREPVPIGKNGKCIPKSLWHKRRRHCWEVRWYVFGPNGKPKRRGKSFKKKEDAEKFALKKASVFDKDEHTRFEPRKITLDAFIAEYVAHRIGANGELRYRSIQTSEEALKCFATFLGNDRRLTSIRKADAIRFIRHLRETTELTSNTIAKIMRSDRKSVV